MFRQTEPRRIENLALSNLKGMFILNMINTSEGQQIDGSVVPELSIPQDRQVFWQLDFTLLFLHFPFFSLFLHRFAIHLSLQGDEVVAGRGRC